MPVLVNASSQCLHVAFNLQKGTHLKRRGHLIAISPVYYSLLATCTVIYAKPPGGENRRLTLKTLPPILILIPLTMDATTIPTGVSPSPMATWQPPGNFGRDNLSGWGVPPEVSEEGEASMTSPLIEQ